MTLSRSTCTPWATLADLTGPCADYAVPADELEDALQIASDVLYALTGSVYPGACTETIRPMVCQHLAPWVGPWSDTFGRSWLGMPGGLVNGGRCGRCSWPYVLTLPRRPVRSITKVTIDGVDVAEARYRVDNHRRLVYQPESQTAARQHWPMLNRLELAAGQVDTWTVEYVAGADPPLGGVKAAAELACAIFRSWADPDGDCGLSEGVQQITRQGVSIALIDPSALVAQGRFGIRNVDMWVMSERERGRRRPATVRIPGSGPRFVR